MRLAGVAEQADAAVLNTADRKIVRVRTPAPAPAHGDGMRTGTMLADPQSVE